MTGTETEVNRPKIRRRLGNYLRIQGEQDGLLAPPRLDGLEKFCSYIPTADTPLWALAPERRSRVPRLRYASTQAATTRVAHRRRQKACRENRRAATFSYRGANGSRAIFHAMPLAADRGDQWGAADSFTWPSAARKYTPLSQRSWLQLQWIQLIANHLLAAAAKDARKCGHADAGAFCQPAASCSSFSRCSVNVPLQHIVLTSWMFEGMRCTCLGNEADLGARN